MKRGALLLLAAFFGHLYGLSQWRVPDALLRYNEACFLTSHNSYAAKEHGYYYAQQRWSIKQQLEAGVRGLMLDTHKDSKTGQVILCHRSEWVNKIICAGKPPMKMEEALGVIKEFLLTNPHEIITIFLENYVNDRDLNDSPFVKVGLKPYILAPSDWDPLKADGWPTLAWMQKHNKRLVIFNSIEQTELTFNQWQHVAENQWGTVNPTSAAKERPESAAQRINKRHLYVVNYFPRLKINFGNSYSSINTTGLDSCLLRLVAGLGHGYGKERLPNFVSLDFIDEGDGMKRVNDINALAERTGNWPHHFAPLHCS